jgi:hypothetical protein
MDATNSAQSIDMWQQHSTTQHGMARSAQAQAQARHTTADRIAVTAPWDVLLGSSVADVNWLERNGTLVTVLLCRGRSTDHSHTASGCHTV